MRRLFLHNNLTREKSEFQPANADLVTVYVCGPTVYGPAHIGNARPAVVFDVLVRLLRELYPAVSYARNITDIDDKINAAAAEEGVDIKVITDRYRAKYHEDMAALGVAPPDIEPHATEHIDDIIAMISELIARNAAYEAEGHVLFDVTQDAEYGSLARRAREDMLAGARVEIAPYKRDAGDFVLWKPSRDDLPGWESPWGRGRPGWHIECSAMIAHHFGPTIDIHGGGVDLQFPHHENECAQSRCAHNAPLARYWLHNGMLNMAGEKMSKSRGNIKLVDELLADYPAEAVRLALLQGHYRQPLDFTTDLLDQSVRSLDRLYTVLRTHGDIEAAPQAAPDAFMQAVCDDLNTPKAMAELFALAKHADTPDGKGRLLAAARILGLLQADPEAWFASDMEGVDVARIDALIARRAEARATRDFDAADAAREALAEMGVSIEDTPDGTIWRLAPTRGTR
ncbi:MAG: cysteine--tRNA ligase [Pseudomonadota bacterium]|nr:cysteine--tRNA ligase [Pseudomonadota bacterium]